MVHNSGTSQLSENSVSDVSVRSTQCIGGQGEEGGGGAGVGGGASAITQSIVPERQ